jgi:hypothetical protein
VTFEVLKRGVAHEVAVLAVLKGPVGPAGAVKRIVVHGNNVHDGGNGQSNEDATVIYTRRNDETSANM